MVQEKIAQNVAQLIALGTEADNIRNKDIAGMFAAIAHSMQLTGGNFDLVATINAGIDAMLKSDWADRLKAEIQNKLGAIEDLIQSDLAKGLDPNTDPVIIAAKRELQATVDAWRQATQVVVSAEDQIALIKQQAADNQKAADRVVWDNHLAALNEQLAQEKAAYAKQQADILAMTQANYNTIAAVAVAGGNVAAAQATLAQGPHHYENGVLVPGIVNLPLPDVVSLPRGVTNSPTSRSTTMNLTANYSTAQPEASLRLDAEQLLMLAGR